MLDLIKISEHVRIATELGENAAKEVSDSGSCNMDKLVLCGLKGVRESSIEKANINAYKHWKFAGSFVLRACFGMADKNTTGLIAMKKYLDEQKIDCYIHYQLD